MSALESLAADAQVPPVVLDVLARQLPDDVKAEILATAMASGDLASATVAARSHALKATVRLVLQRRLRDALAESCAALERHNLCHAPLSAAFAPGAYRLQELGSVLVPNVIGTHTTLLHMLAQNNAPMRQCLTLALDPYPEENQQMGISLRAALAQSAAAWSTTAPDECVVVLSYLLASNNKSQRLLRAGVVVMIKSILSSVLAEWKLGLALPELRVPRGPWLSIAVTLYHFFFGDTRVAWMQPTASYPDPAIESFLDVMRRLYPVHTFPVY